MSRVRRAKPRPYNAQPKIKRLRTPKQNRPRQKALTAIESAAYNEGRIAAIMGEEMCPYVLPESRRQWQAGHREQMNSNSSGPVALAGKGERK